MAHRGSFHYDYDYENYPDDDELVDYEHNNIYDEIDDYEREQSTNLSDVLACSSAVSHQIGTQLLILLCVNFAYRLIRQSSEFSSRAWIIVRNFCVIL